MYRIKFRALQCNRMLNIFMKRADLLPKDSGIGKEVYLVISTDSYPTEDYIHKLEKHIEKADTGDMEFMSVKFVSFSQVE